MINRKIFCKSGPGLDTALAKSGDGRTRPRQAHDRTEDWRTLDLHDIYNFPQSVRLNANYNNSRWWIRWQLPRPRQVFPAIATHSWGLLVDANRHCVTRLIFHYCRSISNPVCTECGSFVTIDMEIAL